VPTPAERRALLFVAAVAALGLSVRGGRALLASRGEPESRASLAAQIAAVDSAVTAGGRPRRPAPGRARTESAASPPPSPTPARARGSGVPAPEAPASRGPVDVDRATVTELDALPGIGPALAARIVEDRDANGHFGSLDELQRVKGIGPALAGRLGPFVTFSGTRRPPRAAGSASGTGSRYPHP
jgi:competence protein ComEA